MKLLLIIFIFFAHIAQAQDAPKITFLQNEYDFGDIKQGDEVEYTFTFQNIGKTPLVLSNVVTTCGCTATKWPRDPIPAGAKAQLTAKFNSAGKSGIQNKVITIFSNASNAQERIVLKANVLTPDSQKE